MPETVITREIACDMTSRPLLNREISPNPINRNGLWHGHRRRDARRGTPDRWPPACGSFSPPRSGSKPDAASGSRQGRPLGLPSPDPGPPGHDLVARRQHPRAVRDGPRHRRHLPPQASPRRSDRPGIPEGPLPPAHEAPGRPGRRPPRPPDLAPGRRPDPRRLHPPGLRRLAPGVLPQRRIAGPHGQGRQGRLPALAVGHRRGPPDHRRALELAAGQGQRQRAGPPAATPADPARPGPDRRRRRLRRLRPGRRDPRFGGVVPDPDVVEDPTCSSTGPSIPTRFRQGR